MWRPAKADKDFAKTRGFKDINFPVKIRDIHKIENKNSIGISIFVYKNKEKYPEKKCWLIINWRRRKTLFLSMNSIDSCMIIHYISKENSFVRIDYMLSLQEKFWSFILKIALKLMLNKQLRRLIKVNMLNSKILKEK